MLNTETTSPIRTFNIGLSASTLALFLLGSITLYSASRGSGMHGLYKTQLLWFAIGAVLCAGLVFIDTQLLEKASYPLYVVCLVLLAVVLVFGHVGGGSQRWLKFGPVHIQPSEFAKIAIIFTFARFFRQDENAGPYTLRRLIIPALIIAPYFLLILLQPDIGTAGIVFLAAASMILFLRVDWRSLTIVFLLAAIVLPVSYRFVLREYQRQRVKTFLDPGRDPRGSGYNALQCKIAVGSGRFLGKGYLKGTQSQLNFIPEQQTDFIFSVFAEERGFVGALVLLSLYFVYVFFALRTVNRARDKFEMLLALGFTSLMFWHVFINIGMVIGILPIVGVTLPFFSYGGSSLLTFLVATALLLNISRKKYIF